MRHFIFFLLFIFFSINSYAQIREIAVYDLNDIAVASYDAYGPVIYYNPIICQQAGPRVTTFFRTHEYGHHNLGHLQRQMFEINPYNEAWVKQSYEREADCWAAQRCSVDVINETIYFFSTTQGPTRPDWYHPTGYERADVISKCAADMTLEEFESESVTYEPYVSDTDSGCFFNSVF